MAKIHLDQDVLEVEALIDARDRDAAQRQLLASRDRYARRPEYKYLQALFDSTFGMRDNAELIREVSSLVADQPDFSEAIALLAQLYHHAKDEARAYVFAREALGAVNPSAVRRARDVLGEPSSDEKEETKRGMIAVRAPAPNLNVSAAPFVVPAPATIDPARRHSTQRLVFPGGSVPTPPPPPPPPAGAALRMATEPPLVEPADVERQAMAPFEPVGGPTPATSRASAPGGQPGPLTHAREPSIPPPEKALHFEHVTEEHMPLIGSSNPASATQVDRAALSAKATWKPDVRRPSVETIAFAPRDVAMPPPPTISPDALGEGNGRDKVRIPGAPTSPDLRRVAAVEPFLGIPAERTPPPSRAELRDEHAVDDTGIGRRRPSRPSRSAMAIPPSIEVQRQWFRYARANQVQQQDQADGFSTTATLIDLAERVVEGNTPLSAESVPLDRRGLIQLEGKLDAFRKSPRSTHGPSERAAVTASAAFLMALLLKECDARAADTSAEDGACKVTLPSGAAVRPLLVAAAYARVRGPGLVESFDHAATAHMRRSPTRPAGVGARNSSAPGARASEALLSVMRRDLDAGTVGVRSAHPAPSTPPTVDPRAIAADFWSSNLGREIAGSSRRVGVFTLADIDALERYAAKTFAPVGFAPPGAPWPWMPDGEHESMVVSWGAVLGEVLNTLYTGRWEADPADPSDPHLLRVVLTSGVVAWPVAKIYLRLARGIPHDLSVYVDTVGRVVGRQALTAPTWP